VSSPFLSKGLCGKTGIILESPDQNTRGFLV
jgi:hypothetical protein